MAATNSPFLFKVHNFGIFRKNGKRGILQLDFPSATIYCIQRGHIKRTYAFSQLQQFDSEEGLHIVLKFDDGDFDFDADNTEEKYTLCRLLSIVVDQEEDEETIPDLSPREKSPGVGVLPPLPILASRSIKDGILEKKGNTTITTWNKRRVKVTPGEFSYYKPGEELALNIVQIWEDICSVKRTSQSGFTVTVRDRVYSFRLISDHRTNMEIEREEWIKAFRKAAKSKRNTLIFLDTNSSSAASQQSIMDARIFEFPSDLLDQSGDTAPPPKTSQNCITVPTKQTSPGSNVFGTADTGANSSKPASTPGVGEPIKSVGKLGQQKTELGRSELNGISPANAHAQNDKTGSQPERPVRPQRSFPPEPVPDYPITDQRQKWSVTPWTVDSSSRANGQTFEANEQTIKSSAEGAFVPPAPPPAPQLKIRSAGVKLKIVPKMKMKQVHWTKVPNDLVSQSFWKSARDVTERLNMSQLDELFYAQDRETSTSTKKTKTVLLEPKRAQNLGILINSMKTTAVAILKEALNSVTEIENFPAERLAAIKRYQPTADDVELYKLYKGSREELSAVDRFMMDLCEIPLLGPRLDLVLNVLDFPQQCEALQDDVEVLWTACHEVRDCQPLLSVLEYVLAIGNYLNAPSTSGMGSAGFQITSIDRVLDVKGRDYKSTLLHFLVEQIRINDPELLSWTTSIKHVTKCADYSIKAIEAEIEVLKNSLSKIRRNLKMLKSHLTPSTKEDKRFQLDVQNFVTEYERKLDKLDTRCGQLKEKYRLVLIFFGESPTQGSDVFFTSISHFMDKFQLAKDAKDRPTK